MKKIRTNISLYNDNTIIIDFDPINLLINLYMELLNNETYNCQIEKFTTQKQY